MGAGIRCMKFLLIVFNFLVFVIGAVAIGLGVWALTDDYGADEMEDITGSDMYMAGCIVIIVGGCVIALISFLGCCGTWTENRCMLGTYFVIMLLFLILFTVGAAISFFYSDDLEEELEDKMADTLRDKYGVNVDDDSGNKAVTEIWDKIQRELKCCGVDGGLNSSTSWFLWQQSSWAKQNSVGANARLVPATCCNPDGGNNDECQKKNSDPQVPPQTDITKVTLPNSALYTTGCLDKLKDEIEEYVIAIAVVAVVAFVILLCNVLFSVCICMAIKDKDMVV